jgi:DNA-binding NarL/FixJ family response regulator
MDVNRPVLDGVEATRQISARGLRAKVLGLSVHIQKPFVERMLRAGAVGYLAKHGQIEELCRAVRAVFAGETYLSPPLAQAFGWEAPNMRRCQGNDGGQVRPLGSSGRPRVNVRSG